MDREPSRRSPEGAEAGGAEAEPFFRPALAIFATAIALRLVHVWQMRDTPYFDVLMGDAKGYDTWARQLAAGDWIGREVFYQAPLYPYVIGVVYALFGPDLLALRLVQAAVGGLSCVLLGVAGARWFGPRVGLTAGLLLAAYAPAIFFDGIIQKSVLDVFFVCATLALTGILASRPSAQPGSTLPWALLGATIGCLSLTRENALPLVLVVGGWAVLRERSSPHLRPVLLAFTLGLAVTLGPVALRNYAVGGGFYLTTSQFGPNFYIGNNPVADGTYMSLRFGRGSPEYERVDATELAERAAGRTLTPAEVSSYWTDQALAFIRDEPLRWLALELRKVALLLNATEMVDTESQEAHADYSLVLRLLGPVTHFGLLVPLAVFGLVVTWPDRRRLWILHAIGLTYALSTVLFFVFARYRFPLAPLFLLFATAGGAAAWPRWREAASPAAAVRQAALPLTLAGLAAVVANWPLLSVDRMKAITETNLGTAYYEQQRFAEASTHYRRALALQADYVPAYNNLGVALRAQGQVDEAIRTYQAGIALRGDYGDLHFNLANALLAQNRAAEAAEHLAVASSETPDSAGVHNNLGMALAQKGEIAEARREFEAALALDPKSVIALRNLASILGDQGQTARAVDYLRQAAAIAPGDADVRYDLGLILLEGQRFDDAIREFRAAIAARSDYLEARNNLGIALASTGRIAEAVEEWEAALRLSPDFADAKRNLELAKGR